MKDVQKDIRKQLHDMLLATKPEAAKHEECEFCESDPGEGKVSEEQKIFTQEQHEQLLKSAVEKAKVETSTAVDKEILRLNERADTAEKALAESQTEVEALKAKISEREAADKVAALADERAKLVKADANFDDEQLESRKAQWAQMSEEAFNLYLEDIREISKKVPEGTPKPVPGTKLDGTRESAAQQDSNVKAVEDFFKSDALVLAEQS